MFDGVLPEPGALGGLSDAALIDAMADWARVCAAADARRLAAIAELTTRRLAVAECADWVVDDFDAAGIEVRAALDAALADNLAVYGPLSKHKLETAIDLWVSVVDPDAVIRSRTGARDRQIGFGDDNDPDGVTTIWGRLLATDAKLLDLRLTAMAKAVCTNDPRTPAQRRADSLGALAAGNTCLGCACGSPACPAETDDGRATSVVIHVLADPNTVTAPAKPVSTPAPARRELRPAVIVGGPLLPPALLAELINAGAKVRYLSPAEPGAQPRYRPSTALDEQIRMRDLTCRAPGCDKPATHVDIDHTIPWPAGPTHPSNIKCYCRFHHLAKTFWDGFSDRQYPDGTIEFTTPTGHTYTTIPFSKVLFPNANTTTAKLHDPGPQPPPSPDRGLKMPRRKRTRARQREYRINAERAPQPRGKPATPVLMGARFVRAAEADRVRFQEC